jgi:ABC-2 type transport system permease protein
MSRTRLVLEVARWEFSRFFKLKEQIISLLVMVGLGVGSFALVWTIGGALGEEVKVAIVSPEELSVELPKGANLRVVPTEGRSEADFQSMVERGEIDALLVLQGTDAGTLVVRKEPTWIADLSGPLDEARRRLALAQAGLSREQFDAISNAAVKLDVSYVEGSQEVVSGTEKWCAFVLVVLMLGGVFFGSAYLFVGITGEKQLRVTEQVVSIISAQTWIDGKILGFSMIGLAMVGLYGVVLLIVLVALRLAGVGVTIASAALNPVLLATFLLLALLGFLFWFALFGAISATVDDPNTSARSGMLFLPFFPVSVGFGVLKYPDALASKLLSMFPLTSPSVLMARLALTDVPVWEVAVAVALLVASIWFLRRAAGEIFELSILMYGKEPTWGEMWRWMRQYRER